MLAQACWEELGVGRMVERECGFETTQAYADRSIHLDLHFWRRRSKTPPLVPDRKVHEIRVSPRVVPTHSDPRFPQGQVRHP